MSLISDTKTRDKSNMEYVIHEQCLHRH